MLFQEEGYEELNQQAKHDPDRPHKLRKNSAGISRDDEKNVPDLEATGEQQVNDDGVDQRNRTVW